MGHASEMKTLKYLNTMVKEHVILKKTEYQNSNTFLTKVNNPFKIKHKKKTEYDSYIRSREMALGREPCAKSWHFVQGLFSRAL